MSDIRVSRDKTGNGQQKRTRAETLRDALMDAIIAGRYPPGHRLDEMELAEAFEVSRTPVREALKQLAAMDMIDLRPHRGAVVSDHPPERVAELFEALAENEAACARLAAIKMGTSEREALESHHAACRAAMQANQIDRIYDTNKAFHEAIYAGAHNAFLAEQVHSLRRRLAPFTRAQFRRSGRPTHSADEHDAVMTALRNRSGTAAEEAMRQHIRLIAQTYVAYQLELGSQSLQDLVVAKEA